MSLVKRSIGLEIGTLLLQTRRSVVSMVPAVQVRKKRQFFLFIPSGSASHARGGGGGK